MTTPTTPTHTFDAALDLTFTREVDVAPHLVWMAWTTPEHLMRWFAPKPYETIDCEIDLRPGGRFRTVMRSPDGEEMGGGAGCYLEVVEHERLTWTSALGPGFRPNPDDDLAFTAVIQLEPTADGGTRYTATAIHRDTEGCRRHAEMGFEDGWGTALTQLVDHVKTL